MTPPAGADGAVQYNNGGSFGGFGTFNDVTNQLAIPGELLIDGFKDLVLRQSAAQPHRKLQIMSDWGGGIGPYGGASGNIDRNLFLNDAITNSIATIFLLAQGVKSDGSMGISKVMTASFRKAGTADPVQIGANTDLANKEDSPNTPTITIGLGAVGTDNIRISYDSNNVADVYTWTFMALVAFTNV